MTNLFNNRLSVTLTDADLQSALALIQQLDSNLPFLIGLTDQERMVLPKINRSNKLFVDDALQAMRSNAFLMPMYIDQTELEKDLVLFEQLSEIEQLLTRLLTKVSHTRTLAGSEAFSASLMFYRMAKAAAQSGLPGAEAVADRLGRRFVRAGAAASAESDGSGSESPDGSPTSSNGVS